MCAICVSMTGPPRCIAGWSRENCCGCVDAWSATLCAADEYQFGRECKRVSGEIRCQNSVMCRSRWKGMWRWWKSTGHRITFLTASLSKTWLTHSKHWIEIQRAALWSLPQKERHSAPGPTSSDEPKLRVTILSLLTQATSIEKRSGCLPARSRWWRPFKARPLEEVWDWRWWRIFEWLRLKPGLRRIL